MAHRQGSSRPAASGVIGANASHTAAEAFAGPVGTLCPALWVGVVIAAELDAGSIGGTAVRNNILEVNAVLPRSAGGVAADSSFLDSNSADSWSDRKAPPDRSTHCRRSVRRDSTSECSWRHRTAAPICSRLCLQARSGIQQLGGSEVGGDEMQPSRVRVLDAGELIWAGGDATAAIDDVLQEAEMAVARWIAEELGG